jgi:osmoprotectant transport system permease protein
VSSTDTVTKSGGQFGLVRMVATPIVLTVLTALTLTWVFSQDLNQRERNILTSDLIVEETLRHISLTAAATLFVLLIAIPLGIALTRPWARRVKGPIIALANIGQATPSIGVLTILVLIVGIGFRNAVIGLVVYSILPVLRNTMVGIEQVDDAIIDAARGMGLSQRQVLTRIELPLAVPVMLAGIRTALVITTGTAALATFVGGGGLGRFINNGISLRSDPVLVVGAVLVAVLALAIDWLGGLAEQGLRPRGL